MPETRGQQGHEERKEWLRKQKNHDHNWIKNYENLLIEDDKDWHEYCEAMKVLPGLFDGDADKLKRILCEMHQLYVGGWNLIKDNNYEGVIDTLLRSNTKEVEAQEEKKQARLKKKLAKNGISYGEDEGGPLPDSANGEQAETVKMPKQAMATGPEARLKKKLAKNGILNGEDEGEPLPDSANGERAKTVKMPKQGMTTGPEPRLKKKLAKNGMSYGDDESEPLHDSANGEQEKTVKMPKQAMATGPAKRKPDEESIQQVRKKNCSVVGGKCVSSNPRVASSAALMSGNQQSKLSERTAPCQPVNQQQADSFVHAPAHGQQDAAAFRQPPIPAKYVGFNRGISTYGDKARNCAMPLGRGRGKGVTREVASGTAESRGDGSVLSTAQNQRDASEVGRQNGNEDDDDVPVAQVFKRPKDGATRSAGPGRGNNVKELHNRVESMGLKHTRAGQSRKVGTIMRKQKNNQQQRPDDGDSRVWRTTSSLHDGQRNGGPGSPQEELLKRTATESNGVASQAKQSSIPSTHERRPVAGGEDNAVSNGTKALAGHTQRSEPLGPFTAKDLDESSSISRVAVQTLSNHNRVGNLKGECPGISGSTRTESPEEEEVPVRPEAGLRADRAQSGYREAAAPAPSPWQDRSGSREAVAPAPASRQDRDTKELQEFGFKGQMPLPEPFNRATQSSICEKDSEQAVAGCSERNTGTRRGPLAGRSEETLAILSSANKRFDDLREQVERLASGTKEDEQNQRLGSIGETVCRRAESSPAVAADVRRLSEELKEDEDIFKELHTESHPLIPVDFHEDLREDDIIKRLHDMCESGGVSLAAENHISSGERLEKEVAEGKENAGACDPRWDEEKFGPYPGETDRILLLQGLTEQLVDGQTEEASGAINDMFSNALKDVKFCVIGWMFRAGAAACTGHACGSWPAFIK